MIWKKYFFVELLKMFFLFTGCFYFLYVLIDYSTHSKVFGQAQLSFWNIALYYAFQFTKRADILVPIGLMISTIKVLTSANMRHEISALATCGVALKKIISPFLWVALGCTALLYLNFQFLQPFSLDKIVAFEECYFKDRGKTRTHKQVNALVLNDNSLLIYQSFDQKAEAFFDVFWLKKGEGFYRMHSLYPYERVPLGKYVDSLTRNPEGEIVKLASYEEIPFPEMHFDKQALFSAVHPPRMQSISQLFHHVGGKQTHFGISKMNDREAEAATFLYFKLTMPLLCLLAVLGPAPFCMRFTRNLPIFLIYSLSLCVMITFFTFVNSAVILGESQVILPILSVLIPQIPFYLMAGWKYAKL